MAARPADADARPAVVVPTPRDDQPSWRKVGAIAAVGFVVGVAWPRIAGIRLGPSAPDPTVSTTPSADAVPAPPASPAGPQAPPAFSSGAGGVVAALPGASAATSSSVGPSQGVDDSVDVVVGHGSVSSCETSDGTVLKSVQCGGLAGLDAVVMPRLRGLAKCKAVSSTSPVKLRFELAVDFARGSVTIDTGRARTSMLADSLLACARSEMSGASVAAIEHEHPRYTATYIVTMDARRPSSPAAALSDPLPSLTPAAPSSVAADAAAQVEWEVALVRDTPKTGKIVARLQRGTGVRIGPPKDGWYPVKYGDGYAGAGWVYRGAIGR